jgi:hypothetical protein
MTFKRIPIFLERLSPERLFLLALRLRNKYPPLFIVGAPRTGTTIIYQHLVNKFHFSYFPNITRYIPLFSVLDAFFGRLFFKLKPTDENRFGITRGFMSPSDGWRIFHRWFSRYSFDDRAPATIYELKNIIRIYEIIFKAPFINKNNGNVLRISHLYKLFPDALFIHVTRDTQNAAYSLIEARTKHDIQLNEWWGPPPPEYQNSVFDNEIQQVVSQIVGLDKFMENDLRKIPIDQWLKIKYEDFCQNTRTLESWVENKYLTRDITLFKRPNNIPDHYAAGSKRDNFSQIQINEISRAIEIFGTGNYPDNE